MFNMQKPYLTTRSLQPENQETPIHFLEKDIIPNPLFYRRNHFPYPSLSSYWLPITGSVARPQLFSMEEILRFPSKTIKVVLECAENKRARFEPKIYGEQWENGAISQGYWKGVPLSYLLTLSGIKKDAKEIVFEGFDAGKRNDPDKEYSFVRSLPIEIALHPDTIIAYEYNHKPIPFIHGYPMRLIVPHWYAMASVKWLKQISVIDDLFHGPFQSIDYVYYPNKNDNKRSFPVTTINVNSTIQKPLNMEIIQIGEHKIKGIAWTGKGYITNVKISTDNGKTWSDTQLERRDHKGYSWFNWSYKWTIQSKGEYTILTKATDSYHRTQPSAAYWNRKGYGYNAIDQVKVKVE